MKLTVSIVASFPAGTAGRFAEWLEAVLSEADQALCISGVVADDLRAACTGRAGHQPAIASFALDAGLDAWLLPPVEEAPR